MNLDNIMSVYRLQRITALASIHDDDLERYGRFLLAEMLDEPIDPFSLVQDRYDNRDSRTHLLLLLTLRRKKITVEAAKTKKNCRHTTLTADERGYTRINNTNRETGHWCK